MKTQNASGQTGAVRQSGVELLRILAGMAVIILHVNFLPGGKGALDYAVGLNRTFLNALECLCICAVNVFLLISGFFGSHSKKIKVKKLGMILLQTILFRLVAHLGYCVLSREIVFSKLLLAMLPINYYVILYVALMLLSPFINAALERLSNAAQRRLVIICFLLFSVFSTLVDIGEELGLTLSGLSPISLNGSVEGYTIVQFALMYLLGAWLSREADDLRKAMSTPLLSVGLAVTALLIYLWNALLPKTSLMYSNPLVILEACLALLLFCRMRFHSKWVNMIAPASFSCYLIHEYILPFLNYEQISANPLMFLAGTMLLVVVGIYALSVVAYYVWSWVTGKLFPDKTEGWIINAE